MNSLTGSVATRVAFGARPCRRSLPCRRSSADERHGKGVPLFLRPYSLDWVRFVNSGEQQLLLEWCSAFLRRKPLVAIGRSRADGNLPVVRDLAPVFAKRTQFSFSLRCRADALQDQTRLVSGRYEGPESGSERTCMMGVASSQF